MGARLFRAALPKGRLLAASFLLAALFYCPPADAEEIGLVVRGNSDLYFHALEHGARKAAADLDVKILVRTVTERTITDSKGHIQLKLIDSMLERNVSAIVLVPEPIDGVNAPVSVPAPLVLADRHGPQFSAQSTVCTDNFAAGRKAALRLGASLRRGARVVVLRLAPHITSTTEREEGFLSIARERGWKVSPDDFVGFRPREMEDRIAQVLRRYPDGIDAIFAPNEGTTDAAVYALTRLPPGSHPRLAGFDWKPAFHQALENGVLDFAILQDPAIVGYRSLAMAVAASRGEKLPAHVDIDIKIVTKENMDDPAIRAITSSYEGTGAEHARYHKE